MLQSSLGENANPQLVQAASRMMSDPSILQAMSRPEVREALQNIQTSLGTINREAPGLARAMGLPNMPEGMPNLGAGGGLAGMDLGSLLGNANLGGNAAAGAGANAGGNNATAQSRPPQEQYKDQLESLTAMGFNNEERNIRALIAVGGDVQRAVNWLIENP